MKGNTLKKTHRRDKERRGVITLEPEALANILTNLKTSNCNFVFESDGIEQNSHSTYGAVKNVAIHSIGCTQRGFSGGDVAVNHYNSASQVRPRSEPATTTYRGCYTPKDIQTVGNILNGVESSNYNFVFDCTDVEQVLHSSEGSIESVGINSFKCRQRISDTRQAPDDAHLDPHPSTSESNTTQPLAEPPPVPSISYYTPPVSSISYCTPHNIDTVGNALYNQTTSSHAKQNPCDPISSVYPAHTIEEPRAPCQTQTGPVASTSTAPVYHCPATTASPVQPLPHPINPGAATASVHPGAYQGQWFAELDGVPAPTNDWLPPSHITGECPSQSDLQQFVQTKWWHVSSSTYAAQ
ncbi:hypothetical protein BDD12DRAFT_938110 [Trichophaea hybrida]|nr:hypothetical protein BDD12DRAFT_938110 [Trichophaea hybrida]